MARLGDIEQMAGDIAQIGVVASVDAASATCTVTIGSLTTGQVPWLASRAGAVRTWSPPTIGEQCLLLAPEGDLGNAVVLVGLYSAANPPPANNASIVQMNMADGAAFSYNHSSHELAVTLPAGGSVAIHAAGGVTITGDVQISGRLTVSGDVVGAGKSLSTHLHSGVAAGVAQSGPPV